MLTLLFRAIVVYFCVLVIFRLMGKRQLGQMQPFELVLTLIIADLATIPMGELNVPITHGLVPLLTLFLIHYILTLLEKMSPKFNEFLSGKPVIIINPKGIDYKAIKKLNITIEDLNESLRSCGYFNLDNILFAIMETNGKISVLPKKYATPLTCQDMKIQVEKSSLPIILIADGKYVKNSFTMIDISQEKIEEYIKSLKVQLKKIIIFSLDTTNGKVYFQEMNKNSQILKTNLMEKS